jgi:hypothetical protein
MFFRRLMAGTYNWGYLLMLQLISEGVRPVPTVFFFRRSDLIGPSPIFMEHEALPQHRSLNILPSAPHPTCLMEVEPWTNNVRIKRGTIGNALRNTFGIWEHLGT